MKVMYVGGFELPDRNAAAHRVVSNTKLLRLLGYTVKLVGVYKFQKDNHPTIGDQVKYPSSIREWIYYQIGNKEIFTQISSFSPDIIIAYNYPSVALFRLLILCKFRGIRLIADCTEWYQADGNSFLELMKSIDIVLRMKIIHPRLNGVIAISKYLYSFYKSKTETICIPPLVDINDKKWFLEEYNFSHALRLVYAGSPGSGNKDNLSNLIKAITVVKERTSRIIHLDILGITLSEYYEKMKGSYLTSEIKEVVTFLGYVDHYTSIRMIQMADFTIFIRSQNRITLAGFPSKLVESFACGTPVITNASSNILDYVIDGQNCLLLDDASTESIVKGLQKALVIDSATMMKMRENCRLIRSFDLLQYANQFAAFMHIPYGAIGYSKKDKLL